MDEATAAHIAAMTDTAKKKQALEATESARKAALAGNVSAVSGGKVFTVNQGSMSDKSTAIISHAVANIVKTTLELSFTRELCTTVLLSASEREIEAYKDAKIEKTTKTKTKTKTESEDNSVKETTVKIKTKVKEKVLVWGGGTDSVVGSCIDYMNKSVENLEAATGRMEADTETVHALNTAVQEALSDLSQAQTDKKKKAAQDYLLNLLKGYSGLVKAAPSASAGTSFGPMMIMPPMVPADGS